MEEDAEREKAAQRKGNRRMCAEGQWNANCEL